LIQALPNSDTPLLNYLTAARAAQKMGDNQLRDLYLREAGQSMPEAKIAVGLTQAQLQLANHQWEQALATLKHLHDLAPKHPYVLKLLMNLYQEVQDWPELIKILPKLYKYQLISAEEERQMSCQSHLELLSSSLKQDKPEAIHAFFQSLSKSLAQEPAILCEYANFLMRENEEVKAEKLLRQQLNKRFNDLLITLYGQLKQPEKKYLEFAETLLAKNPHSGDLYLCLGRLCMTQNLWGKAKEYLEQAKILLPTPIVFAVLGDLYERLEQPTMACKQYKQGLMANLYSE
jgi:HemY protein